jgi:deazaflavin-dependent oxidoreductase (nitroreductase family)
MSGEVVTVPTWTPPRWANAMVKGMLRTPGLQRLIGSQIALISVTGRRTGKRYTTPVSYDRQGDDVIVLTKRIRTWWRNLEADPRVEIRLAGRTVRATARIGVDGHEALATLIRFFEHRPRDATAYGLGGDRLDEARARTLLEQVVVIRIPVGDGANPLDGGSVTRSLGG